MMNLIIAIFLTFLFAGQGIAGTCWDGGSSGSAPWSVLDGSGGSPSLAHADVTHCINTIAATSDTVNLPSGSATWGSVVTVTEEVTIQGQTDCVRNDTTFIVSCGDGTTIDTNGFSLQSNNIRITGITLTASSGTAFTLATAITGFRIDHNRVDGWDKFINKGGRGLKEGLIDHNIISDCGGECIYIVGEGNASWAQGGALGDDYPEGTVYIEDNYFTLPTSDAANIVDAGGGARYVFRYNRADDNATYTWGYWLESHGHQYGARDESHNAGTYGVEVYENILNDIHTTWSVVYAPRGGRGYVYNNTVLGTGFLVNDVAFTNYESQSELNVNDPNPCDNQTHEDDGLHDVPLATSWMCNADDGTPPSDYPCPLQINNFYIFNNITANGDFVVGIRGNDPDLSDYIIEDRDYYDDEGGGDTNFTSDVAANRAPSTCTTDDSYWETDNKKLYNCTSTNTWALIYEPYVYPHPSNVSQSFGQNRGISTSGGVTLQ